MLILALDTSTFSGSIALVKDGRLLGALTTPDVGTHSKWLMPSIDALLGDGRVGLEEVDYIALTNGPGSFTGLRIGVSVVKGLAWALGKPVLTVSSLEALAYNLKDCPSLVCPVIDARKDEVYAALYRFDQTDPAAHGPKAGYSPLALMEDSALSPVRLIERLAEFDGAIEFTGNALNSYMDLFASRVKGAAFAPKPLWHVHASNVALIASIKGGPGARSQVEPSALAPLYHRKSEAELTKKVKI
jgi:tRNA threonylcarbamoyladenosine biosynthesis protein TsaB